MLLASGTRCFADSSEANLTTLVPNQSIYVPRVPTPSELTKVATAQGSTIGQKRDPAQCQVSARKNRSGPARCLIGGSHRPNPG